MALDVEEEETAAVAPPAAASLLAGEEEDDEDEDDSMTSSYEQMNRPHQIKWTDRERYRDISRADSQSVSRQTDKIDKYSRRRQAERQRKGFFVKISSCWTFDGGCSQDPPGSGEVR